MPIDQCIDSVELGSKGGERMMMNKWCHLGLCRCEDFAPLILRLVVGVTFVAHGGQKLFGWFDGPGIVGTTGFLQQLGFAGAGFWAWVVALVEFLGGVAMILGVGTTVAAVLLAIVMAVAFFTVHLKNGFFIGKGGVELVLLLLAMLISLALSGPGKWSLDAKCCRRQGAASLQS